MALSHLTGLALLAGSGAEHSEPLPHGPGRRTTI